MWIKAAKPNRLSGIITIKTIAPIIQRGNGSQSDNREIKPCTLLTAVVKMASHSTKETTPIHHGE